MRELKDGIAICDFYISHLIQFFNPTHKVNFVNELSSNNKWFVFFDFIGRILIAIGIFETIRSFRKYTRK